MNNDIDLPPWAEKFQFWHHSPNGCMRPDFMEFIEKAVARPLGIYSPPNSPMIGGTQAEAHAKRVVIDGDDETESFRHALSEMQAHKPADYNEADAVKHKIILNEEYQSDVVEGLTDTIYALTLKHMVLGLQEATKGENQVVDGPWISLKLEGLALDFAGEIDVQTRGVVELKTRWPKLNKSERGWGVNSLPAKPDANHVAQTAIYWAWMRQQSENVPVTIVYANCKGYRVFSSQDCEELQPARLDDAVERYKLIAKTRENLMSKCNSVKELMSLVAPDFSHWMWKDKSPEYKQLAEQTWSIS